MIAHQDPTIRKLTALLYRNIQDPQQATTTLRKPSPASVGGRSLVWSASEAFLIEGEGDRGACQLPAEPTRPSGNAQRAGNRITPAIVHGIIWGVHGYRAGSENRWF